MPGAASRVAVGGAGSEGMLVKGIKFSYTG